MKRTVILLLLLSAFLHSCVSYRPPNAEVNGEEMPMFYINGELPEIGEFSGKDKGGRFYNEYTPDFIPSDLYGTVIPYISSVKEYTVAEDEEWSSSSVYCTYGLCNEEGRIIMDPQSSLENAFHHESPDGFGYYELDFMDESAYDSPNFGAFPVGKRFLIPDSGKWMIELQEAAYIGRIDGGKIAVMEPSKFNSEQAYPEEYKAVFYDYNGKKLFEIEDIDYVGESFGGLTKVSGLLNGKRAEWLVDDNGKMKRGPFESIYSFDGHAVAVVKDADGTSYLMNTDGERITQRDYDEINSIYSGVYGFAARYYTEDGNILTDVFNGKGELLCTIDYNKYPDITITPDNTVIYYYRPSYGSDEMIFKYGDGTDFVSKEYGVMPNRIVAAEDMFLYENEETGESVVFDEYGETILKAHDINAIYWMNGNERYLTYSTGDVQYTYDEELEKSIFTSTLEAHLFDTETGETVLSIKEGGYGAFVGTDGRYFLYSANESYDPMGTSALYGLYDTLERKLVFENCLSLTHMKIGGKSYFNVGTENYCTLYDEDMNAIIKTINE